MCIEGCEFVTDLVLRGKEEGRKRDEDGDDCEVY
jgi:hypothetical protein